MLQLPSGQQLRYVYAQYPYEVVFVLPLTHAGEVVLIEQYRHPIQRWLLEIPAGSPQQGESLEACARRELEEETGYRAESLRKLFSFYASPGSSDELAHLFVATDLTPTAQRLEPGELITVRLMDLVEAQRSVFSGTILHAGAALGLLALGLARQLGLAV